MEIKPEYGKIILRLSISVVFLWFGLNQLFNFSDWVGFVPVFLTSILSAKILVMINGSLELILGLFMLSGLYLRFSSFILAIHLFFISLSLGYTALAVRDFGLAFATLAIFFLGPDDWCLDKRY